VSSLVPAPVPPPFRILVVDDDPNITRYVRLYLQQAGYHVDTTDDGVQALTAAQTRPPDLIVLDVMLPGLNGMEVCRRLRAHSDVPVVMLTARGDAPDRIAGLEGGADDYLPKPFQPRELVARVNAVVRRARAPVPVTNRPQTRLLTAGDIVLDEMTRTVTVAGRPVHLPRIEHELLAFLMRHPGRVWSREKLLAEVWGWKFGPTDTVATNVGRLRKHVERDPAAPRHIVTVWGAGYRFDP
jgi:DNA-binding response OmpR family regulator